MTVSLFTGVETFNWTYSDFDKCVAFCKANSVDQIVLKIYEITQGEWYQNLGGPGAVVEHIADQGLNVLTYGFFYGDNPTVEAASINTYIEQFGRFCLDLEGSFDNNPNKLKGLLTNLHTGGALWISTWANPSEHGWLENLQLLIPYTRVWMPQVYDDALAKAMYLEWPKTMIPIEPTFHITGTPWQDAKSFNNFSLWEYQLAQSSTGLLANFVNIAKGNPVSVYPTNSKGCIINGLQTSEFQPGHSEFECGAFAVSILGRSTNYNVPNTMSEDNCIAWAEAAYAATTGSNGPSNNAGASVSNMWQMLKWTQQSDPFGIGINTQPLHWWDTPISATSDQSHDLAMIKAAIEHGIPVIATVSEASVFDMDLGRNPYWWGASGNHILIWAGVAPDGNLLAFDPANVDRGDGNLQTPKNTLPWPRRYRASSIDNQWATLIRMPWFTTWPADSNDPTTWPAYVPPVPPTSQPTQDSVTTLYDPTGNQLIFMDNKTNKVLMRMAVS